LALFGDTDVDQDKLASPINTNVSHVVAIVTTYDNSYHMICLQMQGPIVCNGHTSDKCVGLIRTQHIFFSQTTQY